MLPRRHVCLISVFLAALVAAGPAAAQTAITLITMSEEGLWGPDRDRIESSLREKVPTVGNFEILSREETAAHFAAARDLGIDCQTRDVECAAKIGVIAGSDQVLMLRAAPREGAFYLTMVLVDMNTPDKARRVTQWAPASGAGYDTAIEEAAVRLFAPEKHRGRLRLRVNPTTAAVQLDGKAAPARDRDGVIDELQAGDHAVAVALAGYRPFAGSVQIRFKETSELRVELEPLDDDEPVVAKTNDPPADGASTASDATAAGGREHADPAGTNAHTDEAMLSPFVLGGGIAAGVGLVGVVGGGALAALGSLMAGDLENNNLDQRRNGQVLGLAGLVGAVLSGAVLVTGGAAIAWGLVDQPAVE